MEKRQQEKIQKFEEFVDSRLKPDLVRAIGERDKVFEQQKIFVDLRRNIENLEKNSVTSLRINVFLSVCFPGRIPSAFLSMWGWDSMWSLPGQKL
ncbi:unnamed protein product [Linum tenue]|uniref:Uncharacterized protein n=1 Tax=Linum tenue TaxID=586396 RepID=A0AAV0I462_9ROSI|nr:unnamed protein product [Linum tenue]